jgi:hypothetical protein
MNIENAPGAALVDQVAGFYRLAAAVARAGPNRREPADFEPSPDCCKKVTILSIARTFDAIRRFAA